MTRVVEMTGKTFGKLTVLSRAPNDKFGMARWLCKCECGNLKTTNGLNLRRNLTTSCGCVQKKRSGETLRAMSITHGLSYTKQYKTHNATMYALSKSKRTPLWANKETIDKFMQTLQKVVKLTI